MLCRRTILRVLNFYFFKYAKFFGPSQQQRAAALYSHKYRIFSFLNVLSDDPFDEKHVGLF